MKVLVIGSGGREHALVWKIAQSPKVSTIYCAPGNAGIAELAECVNIKADDIEGLLDFAKAENIDLTVVGPEAPLALGVVDLFENAGKRIFGPSKAAALIEGSKALAKDIMVKYNVPTAAYGTFTDSKEAKEFLKSQNMPIVVKADGLAAGKGVIIAETLEEANNAVDEIMEDCAFGNAGAKIVIEEFLEGEEVSILAFTDGKTIVPMVSAQDHKRIGEGDEGLNTGGMGAYSPAPIYTDEVADFVVEKVLKPTVAGMEKEGRLYKGVLYAGLMLTPNGVRVLEYNARFGDPETQAVLSRLDSDLVEIMEAVIDGTLDKMEIKWKEEAAVCIVVAAGGYPVSYEKGNVISGLDEANEKACVFHAGTKFDEESNVVTSGGRVLGVTALGKTIKEACDKGYEAVNCISFKDMYFRRDIAHRALNR